MTAAGARDFARALGEAPDLSLRAAGHIWRRNASVYRRTFLYNILPNFFEPVLYLFAMGIGLGSYVQDMHGSTYIEFLAPGLIASQAMMGASFEVTYNTFVKMHFAKTYQAITATPVSPADVAIGEILWAITRGTAYGAIFWLVVLLFGVASFERSWPVLLALPVVSALFASLGLLFTTVIDLIDLFSYYYTLFLTPLFLLSGIFFPLERYPAWAQELAWWTPLYQGVRACRRLFDGQLDPAVLASFAWMIAVTLVATWLAMAGFSWRLRR